MNQVSAAAFRFLLTFFLGSASGLLSKDFSECKQFFYNDIPPQGITGQNYQPICQKYMNKYCFATLYNRELRVALYSAYIISLSNQKLEDKWMYEPQLNDKNNDADMQPIQLKDEFENQATLVDYKDSVYTKGHLAPKQHQGTLEDKEATYTLTNIVPQRGGSNAGTWGTLEEKITKRKKSCNGNMYVITGTILFEDDPKIPSFIRNMNNRVAAPEYIWSAYCCTDYKNNLNKNEKQFFPTFAAVGRNFPDSGDDIVKKNPDVKTNELGYDVREMPLNELEEILTRKLNKEQMKITLFDKHCGAN